MAKGPILKTERLTLRPATVEDARPMAALINDPGVARMTSMIPHPYGLQDAEMFIDTLTKTDFESEMHFAVVHPVDDFIGMVAFGGRRESGAELGYWLGRPYWGRGYASEAVAAALDWAHQEWDRRFLHAGHFADNPPSGRVLIKSGFLYTGVVEQRFSVARRAKADTRMMVWLA